MMALLRYVSRLYFSVASIELIRKNEYKQVKYCFSNSWDDTSDSGYIVDFFFTFAHQN